jgi:hypothetical protein
MIMGMLVFLAVALFLLGALALFVHAVRAEDRRESRHGWIVVVPLLIIFGWVLTELLI